MSEYIHKSHNVTVLIYHLVFPAKHRPVVIDEHVDEVLKDICLVIEMRYQIKFLEIGTDKDHVHFLVQSVPTYSVTKIVTMTKNLTRKSVMKNNRTDDYANAFSRPESNAKRQGAPVLFIFESIRLRSISAVILKIVTHGFS